MGCLVLSRESALRQHCPNMHRKPAYVYSACFIKNKKPKQNQNNNNKNPTG